MGTACCSEVDKAPHEQTSAAHGHLGGGAGSVAASQSRPSSGVPPERPGPLEAPDVAQPSASGRPGGAETADSHGNRSQDQFQSQVGELPTFGAKPKQQRSSAGGDRSPGSRSPSHFDDASSERSHGTGVSGLSDVVDNMQTKEQKQQAKVVVKDFVKAMVKGRKLNVMAPNGKLKACIVTITRNLDALKIKADAKTQNIPLKSVEEIHAGMEVEGIDTPLDELCATLMLASENCITFRMNDLNDRDTFVMCLLMFCNNQK